MLISSATTKNQNSHQICNKSIKPKTSNQQPCTSKQSMAQVQILTSPVKKQITTLPNLPSTTSLLAKKNDSRSLQTPILSMTTLTQIPSVQNKQSAINQQPSLPKHPEVSVTPLPPVTIQLNSLPVSI